MNAAYQRQNAIKENNAAHIKMGDSVVFYICTRVSLCTLFVNLKLGASILEECVDLAGSSQTGVVVGLGCLSAHLLRGREVATL